MNILMVSFDYYPNSVWGMGIHVYHLQKALTELGHSVLIGTINRFGARYDSNVIAPQCLGDIEINYAKRRCKCSHNCEISCYNLLKKSILERMDVECFAPDIIHCHGWAMWDLAQEVSHITGAPIVSTIHFLENRDGQAVSDFAEEEALEALKAEHDMVHRSSVISISNYASGLLKKAYGDVKDSIVYHGISLPKREASLDLKNQKYLYVGRLEKGKGINELCRLWEELGVKDKLYVIGHGRQFDDLRGKFANIIFEGSMSNYQAQKRMAKTFAVIIPYFSDLFGITLLEAVANKCVPIYINSGGIGELMSFFSGIEFKLSSNVIDIDSLADALKIFSEMSIKKIEDIVSENYSLLISMFTISRMVKDTLEIYKTAVE